MQKECFITVGATATFESLIRAALSKEFLEKLTAHNFTRLTIQYGDSEELFSQLRPSNFKKLEIIGFDFDKAGLNNRIRRCQARPGLSEEGMVICHAGAGTVLDVMRLDVPLIVVPNNTLLDNHQEELAGELDKQGYVTKGDSGDLVGSFDVACKKTAKSWGSHETKFSSIIDDVTGYDVGYEGEVRARLD